MRKGRNGFTLLELSIVLVILGLLIGGILVAQSMIGAAKITATVTQIGQFDAGVANFKAKYNYLPGDAPAFGGDGNGVIDIMWYNSVTRFACELPNFWSSIDQQQYKSYVCVGSSGVQAIAKGDNKNVPESKLGSSGSFFIASALSSDGGTADLTDPKNYYAILSGTQLQTLIFGDYDMVPTTDENSPVKSADLLALDSKIDDGVANLGNVISGSIANYQSVGIGGIIATPATGICSIGGSYLVNDPGYGCTPLIRIGAQAGDPQ